MRAVRWHSVRIWVNAASRSLHVSANASSSRDAAVVWGRAAEGQLGTIVQEDVRVDEPNDLESHAQVLGPRVLHELGGARLIRCGRNSSAVVNESGIMYIMGLGRSGELGLGPWVPRVGTPRPVALSSEEAGPPQQQALESDQHEQDNGSFVPESESIQPHSKPIQHPKQRSAVDHGAPPIESEAGDQGGMASDSTEPVHDSTREIQQVEADTLGMDEAGSVQAAAPSSARPSRTGGVAAESAGSPPDASIRGSGDQTVRASDVQFGDQHSIVLLQDGSLRVMGQGTEGQLMQGGGIGPQGSYHGGGQLQSVSRPLGVGFFEERGLEVLHVATSKYVSVVITKGAPHSDGSVPHHAGSLITSGLTSGSVTGSAAVGNGVPGERGGKEEESSPVKVVDDLEQRAREARAQAAPDSSDADAHASQGGVSDKLPTDSPTFQNQPAVSRGAKSTSVWVSGSSFSGALGLGPISATMEPVRVEALENLHVRSAAASNTFVVYGLDDGTVLWSGRIGSTARGGKVTMVSMPSQSDNAGSSSRSGSRSTPNPLHAAQNAARPLPAVGGVSADEMSPKPLKLRTHADEPRWDENQQTSTPVPLEFDGVADAHATLQAMVLDQVRASLQAGHTTGNEPKVGHSQGTAGFVSGALSSIRRVLGVDRPVARSPVGKQSESVSEAAAQGITTPYVQHLAAGDCHAIMSDGMLAFAVGSCTGGALGNGESAGAWTKARPLLALLGAAAEAVADRVSEVIRTKLSKGAAIGAEVDLELVCEGGKWSCIVSLNPAAGHDSSRVAVELGRGPITTVDAGYRNGMVVLGGRVFVWGQHARELAGDGGAAARSEGTGDASTSHEPAAAGTGGQGKDGQSGLHSLEPIPVQYFEGDAARRELQVLQVSLGQQHAGAVVRIHSPPGEEEEAEVSARQ